ncbi:hypothetical protein, partial [Pseudomonas sp. RTS4]|uniref:hypothetical protein n=1 Tax=Pseudomonas sp. RTS4 TaxID=3048644 RepID=UPI002B234DC0
VQGIAQHMHERIVQTVDDDAIDFGFGPGNVEIDFFAEVTREFSYQTGEFLEQTADRLHARRQSGAL